jgi:predicted GNAT superfamily acetyltransferase
MTGRISAAEPSDGLHIRHLRTQEEYRACVELQVATWGEGFRETVPATILKISQRLGGVTAGAFAADGSLAGFVFGMTGVERGDVVHWSDMLAVRADMQNYGLGRRLKAFQREAVRSQGVTRMYWTYDPLVARNAHFNLVRLGARVSEYVPDMYGTETGSDLHRGFGTDRFVVVWTIGDGDEAPASRPPSPDESDAPILNADGSDADVARFAGAPPACVRVEIPPDILRVQAESLAQAVRWRASSRHALQWALAHGYDIDRFAYDKRAERGFYVLTRARASAASAA